MRGRGASAQSSSQQHAAPVQARAKQPEEEPISRRLSISEDMVRPSKPEAANGVAGLGQDSTSSLLAVNRQR